MVSQDNGAPEPQPQFSGSTLQKLINIILSHLFQLKLLLNIQEPTRGDRLLLVLHLLGTIIQINMIHYFWSPIQSVDESR